jgi:hypothetical protein
MSRNAVLAPLITPRMDAAYELIGDRKYHILAIGDYQGSLTISFDKWKRMM